jgi:hypothetical protein
MYAYNRRKRGVPKGPVNERCSFFNEKCLYTPLIENDWCSVPEPFIKGPDKDGKCFSLKELLRHIEECLETFRYPFNWNTREKFTIEDLLSIAEASEKAGLMIKGSLLNNLLEGIEQGFLPLEEYDGSKELDREKALMILHWKWLNKKT